MCTAHSLMAVQAVCMSVLMHSVCVMCVKLHVCVCVCVCVVCKAHMRVYICGDD